MNIELIKNKITPLLDAQSLELVSVKTKREFGFNILEIIVDGDDLEVDRLGEVNVLINDLIDELLPEDYYLEVASPGAERELTTLDEAKKHIHKYVAFVSDKYNHEGTLEDVVDNILHIKVNLKGRFKVIEVPFETLNKLKLTVKV